MQLNWLFICDSYFDCVDYNQIDKYDREHKNQRSEEVSAVNKTSLKDSLDLFNREFLKDLLKTNQREIRERAALETGSNLEF